MTDKETKEAVEKEEPQEDKQTEKEAEASFVAGFKNVDSEAEPEPPKKAEEPEPEPVAQKAGDDDQQRQDVDLEPLNKRMRDVEGRLGGMSQRIDQMFDKMFEKAETKAGDADTPSEQQIAAARKSSDKFEALKEEFPDWGEAIEEELKLFEQSLGSNRQPTVDLDSLRSELKEELRQEIARDREIDRLELQHPGWEQTVNTKEFMEWSLDGGPSVDAYRRYKALEQEDPERATETVNDWVREYPEWWGNRGAKVFSPRASDAAALIEQYSGTQTDEQKRAAEAQKREKQEKRLKGAVPTKGAGGQPHTAVSEEEAFARGFQRAHGR